MEKFINRNTDNGFNNDISFLFRKDFIRIIIFESVDLSTFPHFFTSCRIYQIYHFSLSLTHTLSLTLSLSIYIYNQASSYARTHAHTPTHTHTYICVCVCVCVSSKWWMVWLNIYILQSRYSNNIRITTSKASSNYTLIVKEKIIA